MDRTEEGIYPEVGSIQDKPFYFCGFKLVILLPQLPKYGNHSVHYHAWQE